MKKEIFKRIVLRFLKEKRLLNCYKKTVTEAPGWLIYSRLDSHYSIDDVIDCFFKYDTYLYFFFDTTLSWSLAKKVSDTDWNQINDEFYELMKKCKIK